MWGGATPGAESGRHGRAGIGSPDRRPSAADDRGVPLQSPPRRGRRPCAGFHRGPLAVRRDRPTFQQPSGRAGAGSRRSGGVRAPRRERPVSVSALESRSTATDSRRRAGGEADRVRRSTPSTRPPAWSGRSGHPPRRGVWRLPAGPTLPSRSAAAGPRVGPRCPGSREPGGAGDDPSVGVGARLTVHRYAAARPPTSRRGRALSSYNRPEIPSHREGGGGMTGTWKS